MATDENTDGASSGAPTAAGREETGTAAQTASAEGTGLEPNVAAALAYAFGLISGVLVLLLEGEDDFVRFHALQSIGFNVVLVGLYIGLGFASAFLAFIPVIGRFVALFLGLLYPLLALAGFAGWAFLLIKAYQGERFSLPVIGQFAANN